MLFRSPVYLAPNIPSLFDLSPLPKEVGRLQVIIVALIGPMKNHLKIIEALCLVNGNLDFHVVGPIYDKKYWDKCLKAAEKLPSTVHLKYHGDINPKEVPHFLDKAHIYVCPSESENFGHSILEALSSGRPVITSYNTPWLNLEASKAGRNVSLDVSSLKEAIQGFINMSNDEYLVWSGGARNYAHSSVDVANIKSQYISLFTDQYIYHEPQ
mgnify:CR=1 FL=1